LAACWCGSLFGLVASFHGIIIGYSRQILPWPEAYLLGYFAVHRVLQTPHRAILAGGVSASCIYNDELIKIGGLTLTAQS
jgi:hypothetical protein